MPLTPLGLAIALAGCASTTTTAPTTPAPAPLAAADGSLALPHTPRWAAPACARVTATNGFVDQPATGTVVESTLRMSDRAGIWTFTTSDSEIVEVKGKLVPPDTRAGLAKLLPMLSLIPEVTFNPKTLEIVMGDLGPMVESAKKLIATHVSEKHREQLMSHLGNPTNVTSLKSRIETQWMSSLAVWFGFETPLGKQMRYDGPPRSLVQNIVESHHGPDEDTDGQYLIEVHYIDDGDWLREEMARSTPMLREHVGKMKVERVRSYSLWMAPDTFRPLTAQCVLKTNVEVEGEPPGKYATAKYYHWEYEWLVWGGKVLSPKAEQYCQ